MILGSVLLGWARPTGAASGGTISGHVRYLGTRVVAPPRIPPASVADCGKNPPSQTLIVARDKALANAVLSVAPATPVGPPAPVEVSINQQKCQFEPRVVAVPTGSRLTFINSDVCLHNVHLIADGITLGNIAMPIKGQHSKLPVKVLAKPGNVHFKCDVHAWMEGYVHVFDHPYFAVSDKAGVFRIPDVPPGTYDLRIEHELLGTATRKVTVTAGSETNVDVDLK